MLYPLSDHRARLWTCGRFLRTGPSRDVWMSHGQQKNVAHNSTTLLGLSPTGPTGSARQVDLLTNLARITSPSC